VTKCRCRAASAVASQIIRLFGLSQRGGSCRMRRLPSERAVAGLLLSDGSRPMIGDGPIRISAVEWVVVRNNPRFPKAVIRRIDPGGSAEHYRVVTFELEPARRRLVGRYRTLEAANDAVPFDRPERTTPELPPRREPMGISSSAGSSDVPVSAPEAPRGETPVASAATLTTKPGSLGSLGSRGATVPPQLLARSARSAGSGR
jgi:hypothetical protein